MVKIFVTTSSKKRTKKRLPNLEQTVTKQMQKEILVALRLK